MTEKYNLQDIDFKRTAIYKIVVQGEFSNEMSERMWGLQVKTIRTNKKNPITSLVGQINDQSALSGILNMLYDRHMTVISVNMLSEIEKS